MQAPPGIWRTLAPLWTGAAIALAGCQRSEPEPVPQHASEAGVNLEPVRLSEHAWYFEGATEMASAKNRGFMSNAGFVVTPEGVIVIDALATPALGRAMIRAIGEVTDLPIRTVIATHYHADHIYGLQAFADLGARIWACADGKAYLGSDLARQRLAQRRRDLSPWVDEQTRLVAADRWLDCDQPELPVPASGDLRVELLSAGDSHVAGDLMVSIPDDRVLFAGDVFFSGRLPYVVDGNTREWLEALGRIERAEAAVVVPGHGPASRAVAEDLALTRGYLRFLREQLAASVEELLTFDQAYARIDWSPYADQPTFADSNRRNAYTVFLELQSELLGAVP